MIHLKAGEYTATFDPENGMNMVSLKKGDIEAIDQSTWPLFEERCAGLGALIGPHFHHRAHLEKEPYSHGVARQVPWHYFETETSIRSSLAAEEDFEGKTLKQIEEQDFQIWYDIALTPKGIELDLSVKSDSESVVGFHTYYGLVGGEGRVCSTVNNGEELVYHCKEPIDQSFVPFPNRLGGSIDLTTGGHIVRISYSSENEENSWQLWHPEGASFVCIEPLSASNPRKPILSVSSVKVQIQILDA